MTPSPQPPAKVDRRLRSRLTDEALSALDSVAFLKRERDRLNELLHMKVVHAHRAGASFWDIQQLGGVPLNTANRWVRKALEVGDDA